MLGAVVSALFLGLTITDNNTMVVDAFLPAATRARRAATPGVATDQATTTRLFYDIQRDPPNENVWNVLANTEKWITATLKGAESSSSSGSNPLSRKEVSYVCETSQDPAMILANIFRKIKEARQLGENHGQEQEELAHEQGELLDRDGMGSRIRLLLWIAFKRLLIPGFPCLLMTA